MLVADNLSTGFPWAVAGAAHLEVGDVGDAAFVGSLLRRNVIDTIICHQLEASCWNESNYGVLG